MLSNMLMPKLCVNLRKHISVYFYCKISNKTITDYCSTACLAPQAKNFEVSSILIEKIPTILQKIGAPIMLRYA